MHTQYSFNKDYEKVNEKKHATAWYTLVTLIHLLVIDIFLYGCVIPLTGTVLAGYTALYFGLPPAWELVLVVSFTFLLMYATFCTIAETSYWKHLFAFNEFYGHLLQVRDAANVLCFIVSIACIVEATEGMIAEDKGLRENHASEGAVYAFFKRFLGFFHADNVGFLEMLGLSPPEKALSTLSTGHKLGHFENGAGFMVYWAILAGCIAKLVYFNTLFTYLRSLEVFLSLNPIFADDDSKVNTSSKGAFQPPIQSNSPPITSRRPSENLRNGVKSSKP